jgi:hypothetical protein
MGMLAIDNLLMALEGLRPPTLLDGAVWDDGRARAARRD